MPSIFCVPTSKGIPRTHFLSQVESTQILLEDSRIPDARDLFESSLPGCPVSVLLWLGTLCRVGTLLVTVETGDMAQVLTSRTSYVGGMHTDDWGGVFPSLFLTMLFLSLLPNFLVGGPAILGPRGV